MVDGVEWPEPAAVKQPMRPVADEVAEGDDEDDLQPFWEGDERRLAWLIVGRGVMISAKKVEGDIWFLTDDPTVMR